MFGLRFGNTLKMLTRDSRGPRAFGYPEGGQHCVGRWSFGSSQVAVVALLLGFPWFGLYTPRARIGQVIDLTSQLSRFSTASCLTMMVMMSVIL